MRVHRNQVHLKVCEVRLAEFSTAFYALADHQRESTTGNITTHTDSRGIVFGELGGSHQKANTTRPAGFHDLLQKLLALFEEPMGDWKTLRTCAMCTSALQLRESLAIDTRRQVGFPALPFS